MSMNNATATFIKLRLFECHAVPSNTYGQVGIVLVEMFGRPGKANRVKDIVREEYTNEQRQRAKSTVGVGAWQQMEWEERLAVLQNGRKEVEEDDDSNLPRIFSEAGVDWEKHGFSVSYTPGKTSPSKNSTMGRGDNFPELPGMTTEVDRVLQGLGLPLDLIKQPSLSNPNMDYNAFRLHVTTQAAEILRSRRRGDGVHAVEKSHERDAEQPRAEDEDGGRDDGRTDGHGGAAEHTDQHVDNVPHDLE